jgi:hypothetical protein
MITNAPFCECGCGFTTNRSKGGGRSSVRCGEFYRFLHGHHARLRPAKSYRWKGRKYQHRLRAEKALGHPLPDKSVVHHLDGSRMVDAPLVICPDQKYHFLLHVRMRVKAAGGNPDSDRICHLCRGVKPIVEFIQKKVNTNQWQCLECNRARCREYKRRRKVAV